MFIGHKTRADVLTVTFVVIALLPFGVAALHPTFWSHFAAPLVTVIYCCLIAAFLRRHKWAWILLLAAQVASVAVVAFSTINPLWVADSLACIALLVSPALRLRVGRGSSKIHATA